MPLYSYICLTDSVWGFLFLLLTEYIDYQQYVLKAEIDLTIYAYQSSSIGYHRSSSEGLNDI